MSIHIVMAVSSIMAADIHGLSQSAFIFLCVVQPFQGLVLCLCDEYAANGLLLHVNEVTT